MWHLSSVIIISILRLSLTFTCLGPQSLSGECQELEQKKYKGDLTLERSIFLIWILYISKIYKVSSINLFPRRPSSNIWYLDQTQVWWGREASISQFSRNAFHINTISALIFILHKLIFLCSHDHSEVKWKDYIKIFIFI